jgi:uncharacterized protein YoxC
MAVKKEKIQIDVELEGQLAKKSINELKMMAKGLNKEIANLTPGTEEFNKKASELQTAKKVMADIKREVNTVRKEIADAGNSVEKFGKQAESAGGLFQKAFYFVEVIRQVYEAISAFVELGDESNKLQKNFRSMGVTSEEEVKALTGRVQALSKIYEKESEEIQKTANSLAKSFGIGFSEALNLIGNNLMTTDNDEMLEVLNEYAIQFKEAGFAASEFNDALLQGERSGSYNIDKVADMFKEFGLRIREQTKATSDSLEVLGTDFRDKLFKGINDGSITTREAFNQIVKRVNDLGIATKDQQTIIADTFGGPGEDLGWPIITELQKASEGVRELDEDTKRYNKAQEQYVSIVAEALTQFANVADTVKKFLILLLGQSQPVLDIFKAMWQSVSELWDAINKLAEALGFSTDNASAAAKVIDVLKFSLTTMLTPLKFVVDSLTYLTNKFTEAYKEGGIFAKIVDGIATSVEVLGTGIVAFVRDSLSYLGVDFKPKKSSAAPKTSSTPAATSNSEAPKQRLAPFQPKETETEAQKNNRLKAQEEARKQQSLLNAKNTQTSPVGPGADSEGLGGRILNFAQQLFGTNDDLKTAMDKRIQMLDLAKQFQEELTRIEWEGLLARQEQERAAAEARLQVASETANAISDLAGLGLELVGKQSGAARALLAVQKGAAIADIIIKTQQEIAGYMASPQSIATGGAAGAALSVIAKARAAISIAKILSTGFAGGGFTGAGIMPADSSGKKPAGIVHANEYVVPENILKTPMGGMMAAMLENMRLRGFAVGGYTNGGVSGAAIAASKPMPSSGASAVPENLADAMLAFAQAISKPIEAKATVNPFDLDDFWQDYNDIRNRAGG